MLLSGYKSKTRLATRHEEGVPERAGEARVKQGFTLVETLLALAILVLLTGIVAMGVPTAFRTYTQLVNKSESQVLLSTATAELRNELGLSQYVLTNNGLNKPGVVRFYVSPDGYWAKIDNRTFPDGRKDVVRQLYMSDVFMTDEAMASIGEGEQIFNPALNDEKPIIESLAAVQVTNELNMELGVETNTSEPNIQLDEHGYFKVTGLKVTDHNGSTLAKVGDGDEYDIQALMLKTS